MSQQVTCPECGHRGVVELGMTTKTGERLCLLSCTRCETKSWTSDGQPVTREQVLRITAGDPDFTMAPTPARIRKKAGTKA